jgi:hypothetical protein
MTSLIRKLKSSAVFAAMLTFVLSVFIIAPSASAGTLLTQRFDKMNDSRASATALHQVGFDITNTSTAIGSISLRFCSNTPSILDACTFPTGMDVSGVNLAAQSGETGFSVHANTTNNRIVLTRTASAPAGGASVYDLANIINPNTDGTLYLRIETFSSTNGLGTNVQDGGVAVYINSALTIGAEVPPYILFCVAVTITAFDCGSADTYFIDFGNFLTSVTRTATSQFLAATNAESGYSVTISGTTLTSGLNTIPRLTVPSTSTTGTSQFGLNLRQNTTPTKGTDVVGPGTALPTANYNTPNQYSFNNGDIIASVDHSDDIRKYTANYITNIGSAQSGGVYVTTLLFICLANF